MIQNNSNNNNNSGGKRPSSTTNYKAMRSSLFGNLPSHSPTSSMMTYSNNNNNNNNNDNEINNNNNNNYNDNNTSHAQPNPSHARSRSWNSSGGYGTGSGNGSSLLLLGEKSEDTMEQQIYEQSNVLRGGVATLKQISMTIFDELRSQDSMLDDFTDDISKTQNSLQFTLSKIGKLARASSSRHMCIMMMFVVFVFVALYWLIKAS